MRPIDYPNALADLVVVELRGPAQVGFLVRPVSPGAFRLVAWPEGLPDADLFVHAALTFGSASGPPAHAVFDVAAHPARGVALWRWALVATSEAHTPVEDLARAVLGNEDVASGCFRLRDPIRDRDLRLVVWSCHQPYVTWEGSRAILGDDSAAILEWYAAETARFDPHAIWGGGDTGYSDGTVATDFSNQVYEKGAWYRNPANRRWLTGEYRKMYRAFWSLEPMRRIMGRYPHLFIWDDHEIHDGWGSEGIDFEAGNVEMFRIARAVADEYILNAGPRVRPGPGEAHQAYVMGPVAAFVFDTRSRRNYESPRERLISQQQLDDFRSFLAAVARRPEITHLVTCTTVPFVNLRTWVLSLVTRAPDILNDSVLQGVRDDVRDSWTSPGNLETLSSVLGSYRTFINERPDARVWNISGDIHVANAYEIEIPGAVRPLLQLTTSAITNRMHPSKFVEAATEINGGAYVEGVGNVRRVWETVTDPNVLFLTLGHERAEATLKVWSASEQGDRDLHLAG